MRKANGFGADIFVSIHNNVAGSSAQGTMIFHSLRHDGSSRLAAKIRGGFVEEFGAGRRATTHTRRGDHGDYYFQLRESDAPAVIVECAFVSNPAEGKRLATDPGFRQDIADAIVLGVVRYQRTLHPPAAPRLEPGTTFPAPLPPPAEGDARALGATRVRLSWAQSLLSRTYRVYRDDVLIAERTAATDERPRFTDRWAAPGLTYEYRIVPTTPAAGATGEGPPLTLRATTPPISVALDPGHGGVDPGAVRHY
jgi:N-acetylmuramoyl-L-alanine amidase